MQKEKQLGEARRAEASASHTRFLRLVDTWICRTFGVLPTEKRFQDLYLHQKIALYEASLRLADDDSLKIEFYRRKKEEEIERKPARDFVPKRMQRALAQAYRASGMGKEEVKRRIDRHAAAMKASKVREAKEESA